MSRIASSRRYWSTEDHNTRLYTIVFARYPPGGIGVPVFEPDTGVSIKCVRPGFRCSGHLITICRLAILNPVAKAGSGEPVDKRDRVTGVSLDRVKVIARRAGLQDAAVGSIPDDVPRRARVGDAGIVQLERV